MSTESEARDPDAQSWPNKPNGAIRINDSEPVHPFEEGTHTAITPPEAPPSSFPDDRVRRLEPCAC